MKYLFIFLAFFSSLEAVAPREMIVHAIGDSHQGEFSQIPGCACRWLGSITMHRVGRDGLNIVNLPMLGVQNNDAVIYCFGEIDVRCHIGKQRDVYHRDLDEIIDTLATKYIETILTNEFFYDQITSIVYSVTPPTDGHFNEHYPFWGPLEDRVEISKKLNQRLKELCEESDILFLDVYEAYANPDGTLNRALSDGTVHISAWHSQEIHKRLLKLLENI